MSPLTGIESSHTVNVIDYDSESITCYAPPAYLIASELEESGGVTMLTVASNALDFSIETAHEF